MGKFIVKTQFCTIYMKKKTFTDRQSSNQYDDDNYMILLVKKQQF